MNVSPRRPCARLLLLASLLAFASSAAAQTQSETERANALIARGVELRRSGNDEAALEAFNEALALAHSPRALAQIALAEQALGHYVDAERHLIEALAQTGDAWIESRREALGEALAALRLRLGTLELRGGIDGADVRIDGVSVARVPVPGPLRVPAGAFHLEVVAPGYYPFTRTVTIVPEGTTRETIEMTATPRSGTSTRPGEAPVATGDAERDAAPDSGGNAFALSAFAVGGASLGTSLAMFIVRENQADAWNADACLAGGGTRAQNCGEHRDRAIRAQRTSIATLSIGGALVATGVVLLLVRPSDDAPEAAVACTPFFGTTTGGSCAWRF